MAIGFLNRKLSCSLTIGILTIIVIIFIPIVFSGSSIESTFHLTFDFGNIIVGIATGFLVFVTWRLVEVNKQYLKSNLDHVELLNKERNSKRAQFIYDTALDRIIKKIEDCQTSFNKKEYFKIRCDRERPEKGYYVIIFDRLKIYDNSIGSENLDLLLQDKDIIPDSFYNDFNQFLTNYKELYLNLSDNLKLQYNMLPDEFLDRANKVWTENCGKRTFDNCKKYKLFLTTASGNRELNNPPEGYLSGLYDELQIFKNNMNELFEVLYADPKIKGLIDSIEADRKKMTIILDEFYGKVDELMKDLATRYGLSLNID